VGREEDHLGLSACCSTGLEGPDFGEDGFFEGTSSAGNRRKKPKIETAILVKAPRIIRITAMASSGVFVSCRLAIGPPEY